MVKLIKPLLTITVVSILSIVGLDNPGINTTAEETNPLTVQTQTMLEEHKEEVESQIIYVSDLAEISRQNLEFQLENEGIKDERRTADAEAHAPVYTPIGTYQLTAYIATGNRCASGVYPTVGRTVACNSLPLGTRIYIEGYGEYVVEDTGGMAGNVIDVFVSDYSTAINFGRRSAAVYVVE